MIDDAQTAMLEIERLQFPKVFLDIYQNAAPEVLVDLCCAPDLYFRTVHDLVKAKPEAQHWLPLWECNMECVVVFDQVNFKFERLWYSDYDLESLGSGYQQFIAAFFVELADSGVIGELRELSGLFNFKYEERLMKFIHETTDELFEVQYASLIETITDTP